MHPNKNNLYQNNNFLRHIVLSLVFFSLIQFAHAQEPLSIGQIYNYDIGDIFQIAWSASDKYGESSNTDIEIIDKYYNQNTDTVFYVRYIKKEYSSSDEPWNHYAYYTDTIFYGNLDYVYEDITFTDPDLYNGRRIIMFESGTGNPEQYIETRYADGLGKVKYYYNCWEPENTAEALRRLTYYKKGEEEWGNYHLVSSPESLQHKASLRVYPNPSSDMITFDFGNQFEKYSELKLFTVQGVFIKSYLIKNERVTFNNNSLKPSIYFYSILDSYGNTLIMNKIIIL